jgi:hypothetical protein
MSKMADMVRLYAISWRDSSAAITPHSLASSSFPYFLAMRAVLPCDSLVARSCGP